MAIQFLAPGSSVWGVVAAEDDEDSEQVRKAKESGEELNRMLLTSLQMEHLVVLAGSGCSLGAGGPSMKKLWQKATTIYRRGQVRKFKPGVEDVAKLVGHDLEDDNIEELLSRIEAYLSIQSDDKASQLLSDAKEKILHECSAFLSDNKLAAHKTFLHRLSRRRARDRRLKVFTTNYDLCFERAAGLLGAVVIDGFSFSYPRRYDARYFNFDIVRRPLNGGDPSGNFLEGVFLLHKLHGSVNWERRESNAIEETVDPDPSNACLIYPARGKYQQSYVQPHLESIAQYLSAIREPNTCVLVAGFGFNDDHLSEPLLAAAESNPHLRLIVVDPSVEEKISNDDLPCWVRLRELCEQGSDVWFIECNFAALAELLPNLKSLTPAENLVGALKRATGQR